MSSRLGTLTLDLIAKTGNFTGPIDKARKGASRSFQQIRRGADVAAKALLGIATASAAASAAIIANSARDARELQNISRIANTGVEDFQRFAFAAETVGVEQDKLSDILKDTTDRVGDFLQTGAGPMADFFENVAPKIGVTADQFRGLSGREALQLYVESLDKANLSQEEMTFFLEAIAGDAAALLPLLRDNGSELDRLADKADRLGFVLDETDVSRLAGLGDDLSVISNAFDVFTSQLSAEFAPIISGVAGDLTEASVEAEGFGTAAEDAYEKIVGGARFVVNAVDGIGRVFDIAANAIVVTFAGALDVLAGGAAQTLEILNAIPTIRLAIDQGDIDNLRRFQDLQKQVAREGVSAIQGELDRELGGDALARNFEEYQRAGEEAAEQSAKNNEAQRNFSQNAISLTKEQTDAQDEYLQKLKETQEVLNSQQIGGLDGQFEQYLNLAKSDIVSGSRFLEDRINSLRSIIEAQRRSGVNPDSIAGRENIVAQLEQGLLPQQQPDNDSPLAGVQGSFNNMAEMAREQAEKSLDVTTKIQRSTDIIAAKISEGVANVGQLTIRVAGRDGQPDFEGQVQANTDTLETLKQYVEQITQNEARAAAGG